MEDPGLFLGGAGILVLLAVSGFFAGSETALTAASRARMHQLEQDGDRSRALVRGVPDLSDMAWLRRSAGHEAGYSLVGMVHTLAPPAMRQTIANTQVAPMHPWDALICTSPSVRENLEAMFDGSRGSPRLSDHDGFRVLYRLDPAPASD